MSKAIHGIVCKPDPVHWLALHALDNSTTLVDLLLEFDKILQQFITGHFGRFEHVMVGVVLVPVKMTHTRLHLIEIGGTGEWRHQRKDWKLNPVFHDKVVGKLKTLLRIVIETEHKVTLYGNTIIMQIAHHGLIISQAV